MAPQNRSDKLKRLVKVQRHLEHMAEYDLANTKRARDEVQHSLEAVVGAIGSMDPVHQIFAQLYSNQISRLTTRDQQLEMMQRIHENKIMREKAKADRLEENMKEARTGEERLAEDDAIYDVIDQKLAIDRNNGD